MRAFIYPLSIFRMESIFGEAVCLEVFASCLSMDSANVFVLFKVKDRPVEVTLPGWGLNVIEGRHVFLFGRPMCQTVGQRVFIQVIENRCCGEQRLLGYGYVDFNQAGNQLVSIFRPRRTDEKYRSHVNEIGILTFHIQNYPGYT